MFLQNYVPVLWDEKEDEEDISPVASGEDQPRITFPPTSKAVQVVFQSMRQMLLDDGYVPMRSQPVGGWWSAHQEPAPAVDPAHSNVPRVSLTSDQFSPEEIHSSPSPVVMEVMRVQEADLKNAIALA